MIEPLEESRTDLTFVTEMVTSSLQGLLNEAATGSANPARERTRHRPPEVAGGGRGEVDLDEVEVQKGVLQVSRALAFIHGPGKSVHLNLTPEAILINAKVSMNVDAALTDRVTGSCLD
jgi:SCY1-like protein 2